MTKPKIVIEVLGGVASYELYGITEEEIDIDLIDYDIDEEEDDEYDDEPMDISAYDPNIVVWGINDALGGM
jgi:hypothetical protein